MGETGGNSIKWNKPDIERSILNDLTHTWTLKKVKYIEIECKMVVAGVWGGE